MDLNRVSVFAAVVERGSFSGAAERLGTPKSSVSRAVALLESELGVRLLHRTTRRVVATEAGAALYARVAPQLASLRDAMRAASEAGEAPSGELRVTAAMDVGAALVAPVAVRYRALYPEVRLDVRLTNERVDLVAQGVDLAVRVSRGPVADSSLGAQRLGGVALGLYASPEYVAARGQPRRPAELADHEGLTLGPGPTRVQLVREGGVAEEGWLAGGMAADDMGYLLAAAVHGGGVALLPSFLAAGEIRSGRLLQLMSEWRAEAGGVWAITPTPRWNPPKVRIFVDMLSKAVRSAPDRMLV